jgi:hypothetical protein
MSTESIGQLIEAEVQKRIASGGIRLAHDTEGLEYVIVRSRDAGVHAGYVHSQTDHVVELRNSRRLYNYTIAASGRAGHLSNVAMTGIKEGKIGCVLPKISIANWCEVIPATTVARDTIEAQKDG